jgi:serine/threonine protein kinase
MGCMLEKSAQDPVCKSCGYSAETEPESPLFLRTGTILENKYLVGRVLGQGGFGITYLAYDLNLNIKLAIKEYFPQDLASRAAGHTEVSAYAGSLGSQYEYGLEKFLQEARTLAQFEEHPNIVSVRDFFKANGTAYFVMSYVEGVTLKEFLADSGGRLPVEQARAILMPVMDALREVHAVDVLHRDVSPDNIFINTKGQVILIDFGAARQAIGEKGHSLSIILKPGYAPEEQYRSKGKQGPWTDIYAVAATYYHIITGQQPPEALERMVSDELLLPRDLGVALEEWEQNALCKALAIRAQDRYQTVADFQAGLSGTQPVEYTPSAPAAFSTATVAEAVIAKKKPPMLIIGLGSALLVLIVMLALWTGGLFNSEEAGPGSVGADSNMEQDGSVNLSGNTGGNIINSGLVAVQGETVFFRSNQGGALHEAALDGDQALMIGTDSAFYINVSGDWIYYSNGDDNNRIYRIGTDGSVRTPVTRSSTAFVTLQEDWIFYLDLNDDNKICRITTAGAERTVVVDDYVLSFSIADEWIYYINQSDDNKIYRVGTDGAGREKIVDSTSCCPQVHSGKLFYINESDGSKIYSANIDGSGPQAITSGQAAFLNVDESWLYYSALAEGHAIYRVKHNGSEETRLYAGPAYSLNLAGNWIVFLNQLDGDSVYIMNKDGGEPSLFEGPF